MHSPVRQFIKVLSISIHNVIDQFTSLTRKEWLMIYFKQRYNVGNERERQCREHYTLQSLLFKSILGEDLWGGKN